MDAITLLTRQHRVVNGLFDRFEQARGSMREQLFLEIADNLAVHSAIEERLFYPAVRARQTEEQLEEAFDEHLEIKKLLVDAMGSTDAPGFDAMVAALAGAVRHHVGEEEGELFPQVEELLGADALGTLGERMEAESQRLVREGAPRKHVRVETEQPAVTP